MFPECVRLQARLSDWDDDVESQIPTGAEVFVFHLDITHSSGIPHNRLALCRRLENQGITVLNCTATNISKEFVHLACRRLGLNTAEEEPDGKPTDKLIIKTNWNYGGESEAALEPRDCRLLGIGSVSSDFTASSYQIVVRSEIHPSIWSRPDLIIERFIENKSDIFYRAYWLRDHLVVSEVTDPAPIKKMPEGIGRRNWFFRLSSLNRESAQSVPSAIRGLSNQILRFLRATRIDFGTLDIVMDDHGKYYFIDLNTTPFWGATREPRMLSFLRDGLCDPEPLKPLA